MTENLQYIELYQLKWKKLKIKLPSLKNEKKKQDKRKQKKELVKSGEGGRITPRPNLKKKGGNRFK